MRSRINISLVLGLLGTELAVASVCRPHSISKSSLTTDASLTTSTETKYASSSVSTATESSTASTTISVPSSETTQSSTNEISSSVTTVTSASEISTSATVSSSATSSADESISTSSSEVVLDSSTTLSTESATTAPTTESSTAQTTTTAPVTTDSSTTESSKVTSTSSAPLVNPTFNILLDGSNINGAVLENDPTANRLVSMFQPAESQFQPVSIHIEEGTGRLRTQFSDYYLCASWGWSAEGTNTPAEVQLCNTWRLTNGERNKLQYITCELTGTDGLSCSAQGGYCFVWYSGGRGTEYRRCDAQAGTTFTKFSMAYVNTMGGYYLYIGPDRAFSGYEAVDLKWEQVEQ